MVKNFPTVERSQRIRLGRYVPDDQADNSVLINATENVVDVSSSGFYVAPITYSDEVTGNTLVYNTQTKEIRDSGHPSHQFQDLQSVTGYGNVTADTITLSNATHSLSTRGAVGVANTNPQHTLSVGSNLWVSDTGSNVLVVRGGVLVEGNLTATGETTFVESQNLKVFDPIIEVGANNTNQAFLFDAGLVMTRPGENVGVVYRENQDELVLAYTSNTATDRFVQPSSNILNVHVFGDLTVSNALVADAFYGEGSRLTNVAVLQNFDDNVARIEVLERDLSDNNSRVGVLESDLSDNNTRVSTLESGLSDNSARITQLRLETEDNAFRLSTLYAYHYSNVIRIANLESNLSDNASRVTVLEEDLADNSSRIHVLSSRLQDNSYRISVNTGDIVSNALRVSHLESNLLNNSARTSLLETYASSNSARVTVLEGDLADNSARTSVLEADLADNSSRVSVLETYASSNGARVSVLESDLADNASRVSSLEILKAPIDNPVFTGVISGDGGGISNVTLQHVSDYGNTVSNTIQFTNADVSLITLGTVGVNTDAPVTSNALEVQGNIWATRIFTPGTQINVNGNKFSGNTSIYGNLQVYGNLTYIDSSTVFIQDPILGIGNPGSSDSGVISISGGPGSNVAFGYNNTLEEFIIAHTDDGPNGLTLTPDETRDLNVHVFGTLYTANGFGVANTNPYSPDYALSIGSNIFGKHDGDLISIRSLADTGIFSANVTTPKVTTSGSLTLESPTTVVTGNLVVQGDTTYVSTADLKVDDPVIELANNNSVSATDIGLKFNRPNANVIVAYKGVDEKLVIAHSETNLSVDDTREMNVQIVGSLFVDRTLNVGSNVHVSYPQGVVSANAFIGDGGLLSNLVTDLQSVTDFGANTTHTIVFEHPVTGFDVLYGNATVTGNVTTQDMFYVGTEPVALQRDMTDNASRVSVLETDLSDNASRVDVLETDLSDNASRVSVLETDLSDNASRVAILENDLSDNASRVTTLETELSDNASRVTLLETELSDNASRVSVLETDLSDNASRVGVLETDLSDNASRVSVLETDLSDNASRIGVLETELGDNASRVSVLETDLSDNASRVGVLETDLGDNASRVSLLETDLSDNASRVGVLETDLSDNASRVSVLETDLSDNASRVSVLETDLSDNASRVTTLESDLSDNASRVTTLETDVTTLVSDLSDNASRVTTLESDLSDNASRVTTLESDLSDNASRVTTLESDLSDNASRVTTLESDLSDNASRVTTLESDLSDNASRVTTLESDVTTLESDLSDNASRITTLESDLSDNASRITTLESDLSDNASRVTTLESDLSDNASRVTTLESDLSDNASRITTLESDLSDNASRVTTLESDLSDNASRVTTLESDLSDNASRVTTLETVKADILDPVFTSNITVSNNLVLTDLTPGRLVFVGANNELVDDAELTFGSSTLTVDGDVTLTGNLRVDGTFTQLSTVNTIVDDPIIELANNNTSDTLDMGIIMTRPSSNVGIGYRGNEAEFMIGHTLSDPSSSDLVPDEANSLAVHVYGDVTSTGLDVHGTANVGALTATSGDVSGDLTVDTNTFHVDSTTDRVGVLTTSPGYSLDVHGTANVGALTATSGDVSGDFAVDTNTLFVDSSADRVGVLTTTPEYSLDVHGTANVGALTATSGDVTGDFTVDTTTFHVDSATDRVGILTTSPGYSLDVHGTANVGALTATSGDVTGDFTVDTTTLHVDSTTDRVGVLTTSPGYSLDVHGTANVGALTATSGDVTGDLTVDTNTFHVDSTTDRVGILTTSPGYSLDVHGTANVGALTATSGDVTGDFAVDTNTLFVDSSADRVGVLTTTPEYSLDVHGTANVGALTATSGDVTGDFTVDTTTFHVDSATDRVGMLTTSPGYSLDVHGTANVGALTATSGDVSGDFTVDTNTLFVDSGANRVGVLTTSPGYSLDVHGTANVGALTATSGDVTGDLTVDTNTFHVDSTTDRVGILTTSPAYELDIHGDANCSTLNVFTIQGLQTLSFNSLNTTTPPLQLTAGSLNDGVGALRIDSVEPDIYLNDTDGGFSTVTFADDSNAYAAFGRNSSNNFYITVRDPDVNSGNWRDDTLVASRLTGDVSLGYKLSVAGTTPTGSNVLEINGTANAVAYWGDGGFLSNLASNLEQVTLNGNTTPYTVEFNNTHTAISTDLVSNVEIKLGQLSNVVLTSEAADQSLVYDGDNWVNEYSIHNFIKVYNGTGGDLTKGKAVYIYDSHNANVANVAYAQADSSATMPAIGLVHETITSGNEGVVVAYGKVNGVPTAGFIEGETVYVSNTVPGGISNVKPYDVTSPDLIQNVGICITSHATNGVVFVTGVGRSNDIPNAVVKTTAPSYVYVNDDQNDLKKIDPANLLTKLQTLAQVVDTGNASSNTLQLTNATTGLVADGNVEALAYHGNGEYLANVANISLLESNVNAILLDPTFESNITVSNNSVVYGGTVACLDTVPYKRYGYAGTMTNSNVGIEFSSNVFYSKIIAQLTEGYSNVSTLVLEVQGGKKPGGGTEKDIQVGTFNKFGFEDNDYPWSSTVVTTPTKVIIEPTQAGTTDYSYSLSVEYMTSSAEGQVETITEGTTTVKTFYY
jgi:chromosome segregation ATPase